MLAVSAIRASASYVSSRPQRSPGTTRADLQGARLRRSAPPLPGVAQPLLDTATQMLAQDEQWQAAPSQRVQNTTAASPSANTHRHQPATDLVVLDYVQAADGQFYAAGESTHTGPAAEAMADVEYVEVNEPNERVTASPADRRVSAYQRAAGFVATQRGMVNPPASVEIIV